MTSKTATLTPSWELLPKSARLLGTYLVPCLYVAVLPSLISLLGLMYMGDLTQVNSTVALGFSLFVLGALVSLLSYAAFIYLQLRAVKKKQVTVTEIYQRSFRYLPRLIGLNLFVGMLVIGGLVLLIVPGLIMFRRYYLASYYLVDRDLSIRDAMDQSAAETKSVAGYIFGVLGVYCVLSLVGGFINAALQPIGVVLGGFLSFAYIFAPALRYDEVRQGLKGAPRDKGWSTTIKD